VSRKAGESREVTLEIPMNDLRYWDEASNGWALEHGKLQLLLGSASDDIRQTAEVTI
jgi:beta-glucosidase